MYCQILQLLGRFALVRSAVLFDIPFGTIPLLRMEGRLFAILIFIILVLGVCFGSPLASLSGQGTIRPLVLIRSSRLQRLECPPATITGDVT